MVARNPMRTDLFDFELPPDRIALRPVEPREAARLLVVRSDALAARPPRRRSARPARARRPTGRQRHQGDLCATEGPAHWPRDRAENRRDPDQTPRRLALSGAGEAGEERSPGDTIRFGDEGKVCFLGHLDAEVEAKGEDGEVTLSFAFHGPALDQAISDLGDLPLPPYIAAKRPPDEHDPADYQTMFARTEGSVAAPTAGLHFTTALVRPRGARRRNAQGHAACRRRHVPAGQGGRHGGHKMHPEWGTVSCGDRRRDERGAGEGRPYRRSRHDLAAADRKRSGGDGSILPFAARPRFSSRRATASAPSTSC